MPGILNLLPDVPGLAVGNAGDARLASGVTVVIFDEPAVASLAIHGGAPGVRDTALLEPEMTVERIDALALSGGSSFGLDAMGGVLAALRSGGAGSFAIGDARVPIVPGAILFDLLNGGDKNWGRKPPDRELGFEAAANAGRNFGLGVAGAGHGANTANLKGGLGSAERGHVQRLSRRGHCRGQQPGTGDNRRRSALLEPRRSNVPRVRRPRLADARAEVGARYAAANRSSGAHDHRHRRHRRAADQIAGQAPRRAGA